MAATPKKYRHWRIIEVGANREEAEAKVEKLKASGRLVKLGYLWIHHGRRCTPRKSRGYSILELS